MMDTLWGDSTPAEVVANEVQVELEGRFPTHEKLLANAGSQLQQYLSPELYAKVRKIAATYVDEEIARNPDTDPDMQRALQRKGGERFRTVLQALYHNTAKDGRVQWYYYGTSTMGPIYTFGPPLCRGEIWC